MGTHQVCRGLYTTIKQESKLQYKVQLYRLDRWGRFDLNQKSRLSLLHEHRRR